MNLFATVLTYPAPSANYRGESEENRAVIQKITYGRFEFPVISPEAMRNALRETLAAYRLPCNRTRLHDEEQLAVRFLDYPDPDKYVDDFFFGYLVAASGADRKKILAALKREEASRDEIPVQERFDTPHESRARRRALPQQRGLHSVAFDEPGQPLAEMPRLRPSSTVKLP